MGVGPSLLLGVECEGMYIGRVLENRQRGEVPSPTGTDSTCIIPGIYKAQLCPGVETGVRITSHWEEHQDLVRVFQG